MTGPAGAQGQDPAVREARLVDQATSMHAALRDRAAAVTTVTTVVLLSASVFGVAFAFAGDLAHVDLLGVTAARSTWLGVLSVLTFVGTLAELVTDRRGTARRHDAAVRLLADLKADYRNVDPAEAPAARGARLTGRYQAVTAQLPPVPERLFNKLKARHLLKVEVSRTLGANPGMSERQARAQVRRGLP